MKRIIVYSGGRIYDRYFLPEIDSVKSSSVPLANIRLLNDRKATIMSDPFGVPLLIVKSYFDVNSIVFPSYDELNDLCEIQTLKATGQSFRIRDIVMASGVTRTVAKYCNALRANLDRKNLTVLIDD